MALLVLGLLLFLGVHSVRIVAEDWRTRTRARLGAGAYRGLYSLVAALGLGLIVWGYALARAEPVWLWVPPAALRHPAALLTLVAFVLLAAAYVPRNAIRARLRHPMVLGVKVWAAAHLLANGTLADGLLFGGFLLWAVADFRAARTRDRATPTPVAAATAGGTALAVGAGVLAWAVFVGWLHAALIGVRPFG